MISGQNVPVDIRSTLEWLLKIEDFQTARSLVKTVHKYLPQDHPDSSDFIASVLKQAKFYKEAVEWALKTVEMLPHSAEARFNASKCLYSAARPFDAEKMIKECLKLRPDWMDAKIENSVFICTQGRLDEGMNILLDLLPLLNEYDPNLDIVKFNLGWHFIRKGDFKKGMKYLGIGRKLRIWGAYGQNFTKPRLHPDLSLQGKTILLCGEGGAGDEMINVRFGQIIKERGAKAVWVVNHPVKNLFQKAPGIQRVIEARELPQINFDYWAPGMDLPQLLNLDLHEIPNQPYLKADPQYIQKWSKIINVQSSHLKIGLRWQGNYLYEQDLMRSVPFRMLQELESISGIDFYSLQRDEGIEELRDFPSSKVVNLSEKLETWDDTAAAIHHLDLIISSCTAVPHLSGAMGKRTWILTPLNPYYIWATPEDHSPWYQNVHLYRQTVFNSWKDPFERLKRDLVSLVARS